MNERYGYFSQFRGMDLNKPLKRKRMNGHRTADLDKPAIWPRFSGKAVVFTGGGTGIGLQIAKDLHAEGAIVHTLGRRWKILQKAKYEIGPESPQFFMHQCDISDHERVQDVFSTIREASGDLYGLVNNAAINPIKK